MLSGLSRNSGILPFVKATIEFDLPADQDAHLDAVQGERWKALAYNLYVWLRMMAATDENVERQRVFDEVQSFLRDERLTAGLTFCCSEHLRDLRAKHHKACSEELSAYLREHGLADEPQVSGAQPDREQAAQKVEAPP